MKSRSKKTGPKIRLGSKLVGENSPAYIIAEAGSNHDRNYKQALRLIDAAKDCGANAVKFQTYRADTLYSKYAPRLKEMDGRIKPGITPYELIKSVEIPWQWHAGLKAYCDKKKIDFCSTPFDLEAVELLEKTGVKFYKVASSELDDIFLLERIARTKKPLVLSTGKASLEEVKRVYCYLKRHHCGPVALLHCVSLYPARYADMNLRSLEVLRKNFPVVVGLSDHTLDNICVLGAVALGAKIIEKHLTLDKKLPGPDHSYALEPKEFFAFTRSIRNLEQALGAFEKKVRFRERESKRLANRSIHALKFIPRGTVITRDFLSIKRPALGISPWSLKDVLGKTACVDIGQDKWIIKKYLK